VSTCREYRRRWASAASPSTGSQCGTVCHQHCVTAACHWTRSRRGWRLICLDSHECHPAPLWRFVILAPDINVMTYLLIYLLCEYRHGKPAVLSTHGKVQSAQSEDAHRKLRQGYHGFSTLVPGHWHTWSGHAGNHRLRVSSINRSSLD